MRRKISNLFAGRKKIEEGPADLEDVLAILDKNSETEGRIKLRYPEPDPIGMILSSDVVLNVECPLKDISSFIKDKFQHSAKPENTLLEIRQEIYKNETESKYYFDLALKEVKCKVGSVKIPGYTTHQLNVEFKIQEEKQGE